MLLCACGANRQMAQQPYPPQGGYYQQQPPQGYPYYGQGYAQQPVQQAPAEDPEIAELRRQEELEAAKWEIEKKRREREEEQKAWDERAKLTATVENGTQLLITFCVDEAMDKTGEYMAGLGISQDQIDQKDALISANQAALADIISRFLGVIKNGVEAYNKETNTMQRNKVKESQLEGLALSAGEKAINKYAERACTKFVANKHGGYGCYVAVHVPIGKVVDEIIDAAEEVQQTDFDKYQFRQRMEETIYKDQQKAQKEQQEKLQQSVSE